MYYEEKMINGLLRYRTTPDGDWCQCGIEKISERLVKAEGKIKKMRDLLAGFNDE